MPKTVVVLAAVGEINAVARTARVPRTALLKNSNASAINGMNVGINGMIVPRNASTYPPEETIADAVVAL
jgi:hypothetical protein